MARSGTSKKGGCYLYALITHDAAEHVSATTGIDDAPVYALIEGNVAVMVSDVKESKVRPERRHIAAHHQVLRHLLEAGAMLPMAFGTIADSPAAVKRMLNTYRRTFDDQLRRLAGKVEMGLRVTLDVPNVFEYYVQRSQELQGLRDEMLQGEGGRDDKIEVGRQFAQLLDAVRNESLERIEAVLASACVEIRRNPVKRENEIANLACLVAREALLDFEAKVDQAGSEFDDDHVFQFSGPWPPHNFVEMDVEL